ncbi:MAG: YugN-like family protein, partial [Paenibacillus sp.]|nr:YugN-like family protein [Paenibacillus sp.]
MRTLSSALENHVDEFDRMKDGLQQHQFTLGGNWDYEHGCYDRNLDEANQVWLRIPFEVVAGQIDGENSSNPDTTIRIGTPFVLKHVYNEGLDASAEPRVY